MTEIIIFIVLGILLLVVEMLVLPGFTVAGIASFGACGYAVFRGFADYGTKGGLITLGRLPYLCVIHCHPSFPPARFFLVILGPVR